MSFMSPEPGHPAPHPEQPPLEVLKQTLDFLGFPQETIDRARLHHLIYTQAAENFHKSGSEDVLKALRTAYQQFIQIGPTGERLRIPESEHAAIDPLLEIRQTLLFASDQENSGNGITLVHVGSGYFQRIYAYADPSKPVGTITAQHECSGRYANPHSRRMEPVNRALLVHQFLNPDTEEGGLVRKAKWIGVNSDIPFTVEYVDSYILIGTKQDSSQDSLENQPEPPTPV